MDTARLQIKNGNYDAEAIRDNYAFTAYLVNPMTWYEGKYGSIVGWIDQWRKPILVAGDSTGSDGYMLLNGVDTSKGGMRLWVNRKQKYTDQMQAWREKSAKQQAELGLPATADDNWIVLEPDALHASEQ